jgi:hypothetical protein
VIEDDWCAIGVIVMAAGRPPEAQRAFETARRRRNRELARTVGNLFPVRVRNRQGLIDFLVAEGFLTEWNEGDFAAQRAAIEALLNTLADDGVPRDSFAESEPDTPDGD